MPESLARLLLSLSLSLLLFLFYFGVLETPSEEERITRYEVSPGQLNNALSPESLFFNVENIPEFQGNLKILVG